MKTTFTIPLITGKSAKDVTTARFYILAYETIEEFRNAIVIPEQGTREFEKADKELTEKGFFKYYEDTLKPKFKEIYADNNEMKFEEFWKIMTGIKPSSMYWQFVLRAKRETDNLFQQDPAI